ncbi:MAG: signal peptidase I [Dehalococcoidia bacterium]|jgi:signal peptidase I
MLGEPPENPVEEPEKADDKKKRKPSRGSSEAASTDFIWSTETGLPIDYGPWTVEGPHPPVGRTSRLAGVGRLVRDLVEIGIFALLLFIGLRMVVQNFRVEGSSMEGTLHDGQLILVNKASYFKVNLGFLDVIPFVHVGDNSHYLFGAPRRGDVIVFRFPNQPDRDFIKRIIAVPGEQVEIHDGLVFINGKALDEKYIPDRTEHDFGPELVPDGEYFVLGDNRNNSYDSRSWGFVPEGNIIGRAWVSYWPFSSFGLISHPSIQPLGTQGDSP